MTTGKPGTPSRARLLAAAVALAAILASAGYVLVSVADRDRTGGASPNAFDARSPFPAPAGGPPSEATSAGIPAREASAPAGSGPRRASRSLNCERL
jgi:hypothetical protein